MSRPAWTHAVRGSLARLVTAVAVAVGLLVLIVPLCGDGMPAMPSHAVEDVACIPSGSPSASLSAPAMGGGNACVGVGVDPAVESGEGPLASGVPSPLMADLDRSAPGPGVLFACVAFLIAVLAAGLWWRRPWSASSFPVRHDPVIGARIVARAVPGLTLAELCVLRT
ncbi:hypothetical protein [Pseudonocardia oceani]|uniref:Uncharacterized protein n=1 Tax=Pseudonocardia oceani TaxID=2792013 RepID=A0ABS6U314_9PSEU|nr:hypothetical protein [Pseudonocardia oceani]MBW0120902.1 hypothetical protein [Pseudonocardia oceani]MBW0126556.1 hypothetical protein [Pseudonocardia oceani]